MANEGTRAVDYSKRLHPPIFLKRNIKLMQKIREANAANSNAGSPDAAAGAPCVNDVSSGTSSHDRVVQVNGLVQRVIPHLNQLTFDKGGEDVYTMVRRKSHLKVSECHKMQLRK